MTRIVLKAQAGLKLLWSSRSTMSSGLLAVPLVALLAAGPVPAQADDACRLNEVRLDFKRLAQASSTPSEWVEARLMDDAPLSVRSVPVDGTVAAITFSRHVQATTMQAPRDFTFRSGWLLNTQFEFRKGDRFRIRARYDVPSGATFYALMAPDEPYLTIFARPDGTLCNKVMNSNAGDHGFLVREYKSSPATKLVMDTQVGQDEPLVLKLIYLGTAGGVARFREVWSRQGRIVQTADHAYDPGATRLRIAGLDIEIASLSATEVKARVLPLPPQLAWNSFWARRFGN